MRKYIGIDIGGTAIKAGVIDNNGQVIYKITKQANINHYEIPFIDIIKQTAKEIRTYASDNGMTIHGIGVSAAGQIDNRSGIVIGSCGNIPNWTGTKLKDEIQKIMYNPIKIENDANCAALAEHWIGNGKQYKKNMIAYTIGTGIGGGIIINGKLLSGSTGIAGEIGHIVLKKKTGVVALVVIEGALNNMDQ